MVALALTAAGNLPAGAAGTTAEKPPTLKPIDSCRALARYARRHTPVTIYHAAPSNRGPYSAPQGEKQPRGGSGQAGDDGNADALAGGEGSDDFSRTNVQEEGIDEPDRVKTDGTHLFVVGGPAGDVIHALDARAATPALLGSVKLPGEEAELLVSGDRILAISWGMGSDYDDATILTEVDVSNPAAMRVLRTEKVEGYYVSARLHGSVARVAISTLPDTLTVEQPADEDWDAAERHAMRRRAAARAPLSTWRPNEVIADRTTGVRTTRGAVRCNAVRRPREYAGLGMLSVLTVDMARGLPAVDADAVFAEGDTLYAGNDGLYVATEEWIEQDTSFDDLPSEASTSIHKFAIDGATTEYRASGSVPGYMLSQWAMSEHEGFLRTATTNVPPWLDDDAPVRQVDSQVIVLAERDGALVEVGRAGGIGKGDEIQGVRFMGDRGFVVTFKQVDPLYTLDLSVPEAPRVVGELKIPGYSSYLHPVGANLLLGVGQEGTDEGDLTGFQLSLFDVSDMSQPRRVAQRTVAGDSYSDAEWDHHAFLYWPATGLAVVPLELWADEDADKPEFTGAIGLSVDTGAPAITESWRIASPPMRDPYDWNSPPYRNLVIGDRLFSVWRDSVRASRLDDVSQAATVALPGSGEPGQPRGGMARRRP